MKKIIKKVLAGVMVLVLCILALVGCKGSRDIITVISREEGSGTRGAFTELFGIEQKNDEGISIDYTVNTAEITDSTSVMMTSVEGNESAIGYISLGALNNTVKALKIDGAAASVENVKNGSYKVSRSFNIATLENVSEAAKDFIGFIMSTEGQEVVEKSGYISETNAGKYISGGKSGKITVGGSSSVTPVMEKLKEAYLKLNPNMKIDIQQSDSSRGISSVIDGLYDIGMSSRPLKESEALKGISSTAIALDGIAVIVNNNSALDELTSKQIREIYTGEITLWSRLQIE